MVLSLSSSMLLHLLSFVCLSLLSVCDSADKHELLEYLASVLDYGFLISYPYCEVEGMGYGTTGVGVHPDNRYLK